MTRNARTHTRVRRARATRARTAAATGSDAERITDALTRWQDKLKQIIDADNGDGTATLTGAVDLLRAEVRLVQHYWPDDAETDNWCVSHACDAAIAVRRVAQAFAAEIAEEAKKWVHVK
jgi:hypothetical protein